VDVRKPLRRISTDDFDERVKEAAATVGDYALIGKMAAHNMTTGACHYHLDYLSRLYRNAGRLSEGKESHNLRQEAFNCVITYIQSQKNTATSFKMTDIVNIYGTKLQSLGLPDYVHTTCLRSQLLASIPNLIEVPGSANYIDLVFKTEVSDNLQKSTNDSD
jgi:hypothetical protein